MIKTPPNIPADKDLKAMVSELRELSKQPVAEKREPIEVPPRKWD